MALVVHKRITLEFLGEDYAEGYLVLQSVPMSEYGELVKASEKLAGDGLKSLQFIQDQVVSRFVEGKFPSDGKLVDLTKDNLPELPGEVFVEAMTQLMGSLSPKG